MKPHVAGTGALALALVVLHAGCSSSKDPAPTPDGGASSSSGGKVTPTRLTDGGLDCSKTEDVDTCSQCCIDALPEPADLFSTYTFKCYCQPGPDFCKDICKDTFCGTVSPVVPDGDPCNDCLAAKDQACAQEVDTKCGADPKCSPELQCLKNAACTDKKKL